MYQRELGRKPWKGEEGMRGGERLEQGAVEIIGTFEA